MVCFSSRKNFGLGVVSGSLCMCALWCPSFGDPISSVYVGDDGGDVPQMMMTIVGWWTVMSDLVRRFCFTSDEYFRIRSRCAPCCGALRSSPDQWGFCLRASCDDGVAGAASELSGSVDSSSGGALGDIFPLPYLWRHPRKPRGKSARSRGRYQVRLRVAEWGRRLVDTLNEWYSSLSSAGTARKQAARRRRRSSGRGHPSSVKLSRLLDRLRSRVHHVCREYFGGKETNALDGNTIKLMMSEEFYGVLGGGSGGRTRFH